MRFSWWNRVAIVSRGVLNFWIFSDWIFSCFHEKNYFRISKNIYFFIPLSSFPFSWGVCFIRASLCCTLLCSLPNVQQQYLTFEECTWPDVSCTYPLLELMQCSMRRWNNSNCKLFYIAIHMEALIRKKHKPTCGIVYNLEQKAGSFYHTYL